jgi:hypothetical protein
MVAVKGLLFAVAGAALAGCHREPNYSNVETMPHEWNLPGPDYERKVFGPMPYEEAREFARQMESEGWSLVGFEAVSLPEGVMVDATELDPPAPRKEGLASREIPPTMTDDFGSPRPSIPPYLQEPVRAHRQKYLVILRRWV